MAQSVLKPSLNTEELVYAALAAMDEFDSDSASATDSPPASPCTSPRPESPSLLEEDVFHQSAPASPSPAHSISIGNGVGKAAMSGKKRRQIERKKKQRAAQRAAEEDQFGGKVRSTSSKRLSGIPAMKVDSSAMFSNIARGGFVGKRGKLAAAGEAWTLHRLQAEGFKVIPWDGR